MKLSWSQFVDLITLIWLAIWIVGLVTPDPELESLCDNINLALLSIFVADLFVLYRRVRNWHIFLHQHWLDILMVIPYFRVLRILRLLRLLRFLRLARVARVARIGARVEKNVKGARKLVRQAAKKFRKRKK